MAKVYNNRLSEFIGEKGGRVFLLFLLFSLALYEFLHSGLSTFAIICLSPGVILFIYMAFRWRTSVFWLLIVANWFIQFKNIYWPVPLSLVDESLELTLIAIALIDIRKETHFGRAWNLMLFALMIWFGLCFIEILNDTCGLGINMSAWFSGARLMALQLLWIILVFALYITNAQTLSTYLRVWAGLSLFSAFWTWKMINIGLTPGENAFLYGPGGRTHLLNAGTLIRYWSTFSDAANYGCNASASAVAFLVFGITAKIKKDKIFYFLTAAAVIWGMFQSGTRTAMFTMIAGFMVFLVLARSMKILIPSAVVGFFFLFILIFTNIGNGNQQIRRMRSAFDKKDASASVRDINQAAIKKYMRDAPWGIGIGIFADNIPSGNRYKMLAMIPPDSEYVFIWVRTGYIGVTVFSICMILMLLGACYVVIFKLKSPSLIGIGGGMCSAFTAIQVSGIANQVIFQYPNGLTFFGGLTIVYLLPYIEKEWMELEEKRLALEAEKKRIKLEKKLAKRV